MKRLSLLAFLLAAACSPPPPPPPPTPPAPDPTAVRRAIEELNAKGTAAIMKGDAAGMVSTIYADDAVLMMPGAPKATGKDAIVGVFSGMLKEMTIKSIAFRTDEVIVQGDYAVETGGFTMTAQPLKGPEVKDTGKYITVWKKQADGSWKVIRDISNSDGPAPK